MEQALYALLTVVAIMSFWWMVGLGFAAYGFLAGGWLFRAL
ncbi:MAG: hypothetical protein AAF249_08625 [Pseudomonadota bacterium]